MEKKHVARSSWSGKWAFILAAAASAVGLGNMWRFPYLAAKYGGGMFLITYLVLVVTFGFTLMVVEASIGRKTSQSAIGAFSAFGKKYKFIGVFQSIVPFIITPYYCVIGGWVAKYAVSYITHGPDALADGGGFFTGFIAGNYESFAWMTLFIVLVGVVIFMGVKGGIEKSNKILMPLLIVMAVGISVYVMTMPGAIKGLGYYFIPDFTKFSPELVIAAMGQMFYSLSLAMGIMVTYGSYMKKDDDLEGSVRRIEIFDTGIAILAGLMIVPAAFVALGSGEAVASASGPSLMFIVLPQIFDTFGSVATALGAIFFLLVMFAALTSAISLTETLVSIIQDGLGATRNRSFVICMIYLLVVAVIVNLGYNDLSWIQPLGEGSSILDFMDFISNSVMMPIASLMTCIFIGWVVKPKVIIDEVKSSGKFKSEKLFVVMVKYVAPVLVTVILVAYTAAQFGFFSM